MSVTYNTTLKSSRMTDVVTAIDAGGAGYIEIGTAGMATVLSTIAFNATCGAVSAGVLTFGGMPLTDPSAANSGTAAAAQVFSGGNTSIITGLTVGTISTDLILSSTTIIAGQPVTLTAATITHG